MVADEEKGQEWNFTSTKDDFPQRRSDSADTPTGQRAVKKLEIEGIDEPSGCPKEYKEFERLFQEETTSAALPKH